MRRIHMAEESVVWIREFLTYGTANHRRPGSDKAIPVRTRSKQQTAGLMFGGMGASAHRFLRG